MILPLGDDNSDRERFPFVNYTLIALNILVFVAFQWVGYNETFTYTFSTVPEEIVTGRDLTEPVSVGKDAEGNDLVIPHHAVPLTPYLTLVTSMFLHGGIAHILGNMLFLWVFGDNIENAMGHVRYLVFYLVCGVLASLAHVFSTVALDANTNIPSLGASGAISGVLGAYIFLYPWRRVTVLLLRVITQVPAVVAIGMWFVFQLVSTLGMLGGMDQGGVAYAAHVGGFVAGLVLVKPFTLGPPWGL